MTYKSTWGTRLGKDCISLDCSLAEWLGARLLFLAQHAHGYPGSYITETDTHGNPTDEADAAGFARWKDELTTHGQALLTYASDKHKGDVDDAALERDAQAAMHWVADMLPNLWD
jgi:hypothetical protein